MPQPIFGIIFGDNGTFADFSTTQAPALKFLICFGLARAVAFTELGNAHCPLPSSALLLDFRYHGDFAIIDRDDPGDRARNTANAGEFGHILRARNRRHKKTSVTISRRLSRYDGAREVVRL